MVAFILFLLHTHKVGDKEHVIKHEVNYGSDNGEVAHPSLHVVPDARVLQLHHDLGMGVA